MTLSPTAYARHRKARGLPGGSHVAVLKAIKAGRIGAGLAASKGEARRLIRGGGARLNGERIGEETRLVGESDLQGGELTLSSGRKRHVVVRAA